MTIEQITALDVRFNFTDSSNAEIAFAWFMVAIRNNYLAALPAIEKYLESIGRGKFVRPLYSALRSAGYNDKATEIYRKARAGYHPSIIGQLDKIMAS